MAFFICRAIHRDAATDPSPLYAFLDRTIDEYINTQKPSLKMTALLQAKPQAATEACWDWKSERLPIPTTIQARVRGGYNGHPVIPSYFGAYCMDGLAMALWAMSQSSSATDGIVKVVNLCGDADTTGAIAGQMLGAFYGYRALLDDPMGRRMVENLRVRDPDGEVPLRAALLMADGERAGPEEQNLSVYAVKKRKGTTNAKNRDESKRSREEVAED